jgi:hypothetical protein
MHKETTMRSSIKARKYLAAAFLTILCVGGLAAQASTSLPTRKLALQVNLKANENYYLDNFKADGDRKEAGFGKQRKLSSKDKLNIILDTIDMFLFRQYCDREDIRVSDSEVAAQLAQYKASLGPQVSDAMVEANLQRSGVFTDAKTYVKHDLLFGTYLKKKYPAEIASISQPGAPDIIKVYEDMKFNLRRPSFYRFSMLIAPTQGKTDADKKKAADTMRALADTLKKTPSAYEESFIKGMTDPKGSGYQTMPYVIIAKTAEARNQSPNLYDQIFKLKEGEISDVIEESMGYCVVRVIQYLPEKQLGLDDFIEGLSAKTATANPSATVLALVANEFQTSKYNELAQKARAEINAKTRKEGKVTIYASNLADQLEEPEIAALKALAGKSSGYSVEIK